jgi:hypothetical protein
MPADALAGLWTVLPTGRIVASVVPKVTWPVKVPPAFGIAAEAVVWAAPAAVLAVFAVVWAAVAAEFAVFAVVCAAVAAVLAASAAV